MIISQRGASSLGIAIAISFSIGGFILIISLLTPLSPWRDAISINQNIDNIITAASSSYRQDVMKSRCLNQVGLMNVQRLINEGLIPDDINQGLWVFNVNFSDLIINTWSRPSQIIIDLTFNSDVDMQAVMGYLPPSKNENLTMTFTSPLYIDITDNWSHFNKLTGCYEQ